MDLDFLCTSLIIGGFHVLGTVNNVYDMEIWYQFYYVFFFNFVLFIYRRTWSTAQILQGLQGLLR